MEAVRRWGEGNGGAGGASGWEGAAAGKGGGAHPDHLLFSATARERVELGWPTP